MKFHYRNSSSLELEAVEKECLRYNTIYTVVLALLEKPDKCKIEKFRLKFLLFHSLTSSCNNVFEKQNFVDSF